MGPGFVDAHTHLIFGGERSREFELRNRGATYLEIAQAGQFGLLATLVGLFAFAFNFERHIDIQRRAAGEPHAVFARSVVQASFSRDGRVLYAYVNDERPDVEYGDVVRYEWSSGTVE